MISQVVGLSLFLPEGGEYYPSDDTNLKEDAIIVRIPFNSQRALSAGKRELLISPLYHKYRYSFHLFGVGPDIFLSFLRYSLFAVCLQSLFVVGGPKNFKLGREMVAKLSE